MIRVKVVHNLVFDLVSDSIVPVGTMGTIVPDASCSPTLLAIQLDGYDHVVHVQPGFVRIQFLEDENTV